MCINTRVISGCAWHGLLCYLEDVVRSPMSPDAMPAMHLLHQSGASMWCPALLPRFSLDQPGYIKPKLFARMTPVDPGQHQIKYTTWRFLWLTHNTNFRFLVFSYWQLTTIKEISYSSFLLVNAKWISLQINFFTPLLQSLKQRYGQQVFLLSLPFLSPLILFRITLSSSG